MHHTEPTLKEIIDAGNGLMLDLYGTNLSGTDLSRADLSGANLSGAILCDANFNGALITYRNTTVRITFSSEKDEKDEHSK